MSFKPLGPDQPFRNLRGGESPAPPERGHLKEVPAGDSTRSAEETRARIAEAREEGAAEAREELQAELAQLKEVVDAVLPAVQQLEALRKRTLSEAAEDIAEIVRLFATRIVQDALAMHPDALPRLVTEALSQLPEHEEVTITVSPQSAETLSRALPADLRDRVQIDMEMGPGAVVRTRNASVDATLQTATEGLDAALRDWLGEQWWVEGEAR